MRNYILYIICVIIASCNPKEEPVDIIPNPVFFVSGTVDGKPLKLEAGVNNYSMDANISVDTSGLLIFSGVLGNKDCSTCGPSIKFTVRNYTSNSNYSIDSALVPGKYEFYDNSIAYKTYYKCDLISQAKGAGTTESNWEVKDQQSGITQTMKGEAVSTRLKSDEPNTTLSITLSNSFSSGCNSTNTQYVQVPSKSDNVFVDFNVNYIDDYTILFNALPVNQSETAKWDFGDGTTAEGNIVKHTYDSTKTYKVCMSTDTFPYCKYVNTKNATACVSNFSYKITQIIDKLQLSNVSVEYRDASGHLYKSDFVKENDNAQFIIIETTPYEKNSKGNETVKVKIRFDCKVSDGSSTLQLQNIEAVIAVAY